MMPACASFVRARAGIRPCALALMLLAVTATAGAAQPDIFGPTRSAWGPRLDTIGVAGATRVMWRGYATGAGASAGAAVGIWGRSVTAAGAWDVSAIATGRVVDARQVAGSRADAALEVGRLIGGSGAVLTASAGGYWLHDAPGDGIGGEGGLRISGIEIPFVPEVRPTLRLQVARATGPLDGTFLGAAIRQDVGIQQYALGIELGADVDDVNRDAFTSPRWRAELAVAKGFDRWTVRLEGGAVRAGGATLGWGGAGLVWRY